eukprot:4681850-Pyramimonas_sp.AAC.1
MRLHRGRSRSPSVVRINEHAEVISIDGNTSQRGGGRGGPRARGDRSGNHGSDDPLAVHLRQAVAAADDPQIKGVLQAQLARLDAVADEGPPRGSVVESMRQADGAWRAA